MTERTLLHIEQAVATLTLNRPDVHNAFDDALIAELTGRLHDLAADDAVRVVVLAASGKSFSAGADLNWMRRMADYDEAQNFADAMRLAELMQALDRLARPTVARVQGAAFGGGVGLIACCDIAVAGERALFSLSEVRLGLIPAVISPYVINAIGARAARRYFLSAERFDAREALHLGLVHEVVPEEQLDAALQRILRALASGGPQAQREAKRLVGDVSGLRPGREVLEETARRIAALRASPEGREGVEAFLAKRAPRWSDGR